ncbi:hypothetical protein PIB30_073685 [Stylosanthes scabra]|uniref:Protein kinase domain-containing protein n=1 Tax=Stylosanthes scabra TaxID=79078 RepID=A0ABU6SPJ6_9FABA|nr:hypothetical protein [Stylosanthes scabra]
MWDLEKATYSFTTLIGQGAFGPVYKTEMCTGDTVAIKVLATNSKQGEKEFHTEKQRRMRRKFAAWTVASLSALIVYHLIALIDSCRDYPWLQKEIITNISSKNKIE